MGKVSSRKTIDDTEKAQKAIPQIEVLLKEVFDKVIFLDLVRHFVVFEKEGTRLIKKIAAYHQYHAVNKAISETLKATKGDKRCGVWFGIRKEERKCQLYLCRRA